MIVYHVIILILKKLFHIIHNLKTKTKSSTSFHSKTLHLNTP